MSTRERSIADIFEDALTEAASVECSPTEYADALDEVVSIIESSRDAARADVRRAEKEGT